MSTRTLVLGLLFLVAGLPTPGVASSDGLVHPRRVRGMTQDGLPNLRSSAAYVVAWPSGRVILERDADVVRPVASLSKLMGSLVIAEECALPAARLQEVTPAARRAAALMGGNRYSKLKVGWSYTVDDLMHAALLRSDNKALPALAEACGLDASGLGQRMTARASKMGLLHTAFVEPDGLSEHNVSTAREMGEILRAVLANNALRVIMAKDSWTITAHQGSRTTEVDLKNTDKLLGRDGVAAIGGKTGFTNLARYCLAAAAKLPEAEPGAAVAMVFLGAEGRDTRFGDFMRMYKWITAPELAASRKAHPDTIKLESVAAPLVTPAVGVAVAGGVAAPAGAVATPAPGLPVLTAAAQGDAVAPAAARLTADVTARQAARVAQQAAQQAAQAAQVAAEAARQAEAAVQAAAQPAESDAGVTGAASDGQPKGFLAKMVGLVKSTVGG